MDGKLNSLSMPSLFLRKLFLGQNNDFYVWASSGDNHMLKHYTYDETMPSVPTDTLTVYGLNLENAGTIRQAASMFQLDHPDVRVELIDGGIEAGSATVNDTIRAVSYTHLENIYFDKNGIDKIKLIIYNLSFAVE